MWKSFYYNKKYLNASKKKMQIISEAIILRKKIINNRKEIDSLFGY